MPSIRIIDSRIPNFAGVMAALPSGDFTLTLNDTDSLDRSVRRLASALQSGRRPPMDLYIAAHGSSGHLSLGGNPGLGIGNASVMSPLRGHVRGFPGGIRIWGCNVASAAIASQNIIEGAIGTLDSGWGTGETSIRSGAGFRLLLALARAVGVPATGALNQQWVQSSWRFVGPTLTVDQSGNYQTN